MKAIFAAAVALLTVCGMMHNADANGKDEAQIRMLLDRWAKAFHDRDKKEIKAMYAPGDTLVAFDVVAPLQYSGFAAYQREYENFLAQYEGPITVRYRDVHVAASGDIAYAFGLERMRGR